MKAMKWIGICIVLISCGFMFREHRIIRNSHFAYGVVIELVPHFRNGGKTYTPRIEYVTLDNKSIVFRSAVSSPNPGLLVGQSVAVAYDSKRPHDARILNFAYRFSFLYCFLIFGLLLIYMVYVYKFGNYWIKKKFIDDNKMLVYLKTNDGLKKALPTWSGIRDYKL